MEMKRFPTINLEATGKHIAELRKERGLSVKDLQHYFGFDAPQAIYKWQRGLTLPTVDNLLALSALLEVPMESILVTRKPNITILTDREPEGSVFFALFSAATGRDEVRKTLFPRPRYRFPPAVCRDGIAPFRSCAINSTDRVSAARGPTRTRPDIFRRLREAKR